MDVAQPNDVAERVLWEDGFADGLSVGSLGSDARWAEAVIGPHRPNDGVVTRTAKGIRVAPPRAHPGTGEPAFSLSVPQNHLSNGLIGDFDHPKWVMMANLLSPDGGMGVPALAGKVISVEATVGGRTFGTNAHPFGKAVVDAASDPRLATPAMITADPATGMVFDFFLTNGMIYAVYERLAYHRETLGNYAAFTFCVPVGRRAAGDVHQLKVAYSPDDKAVRWFVDEREVLTVDRIGHRIDRQHMIVDKGGEETEVAMNQLTGGLGIFTMLGGAMNGGPGLVDLWGVPDSFDPARGEPHASQFVDGEGNEASRLFGQGAELTCDRFRISYQ